MLARLQPLQQAAQRGQVEDVLQALAVGLEDDRERSRTSARPAAATAPSAAAARAACARRDGGAGSAARGPRSRGSARRRAPCRPAPRRRDPRPRPGRRADPRSAAARRPRGSGARCRRPTRSTAPRSPSASRRRAAIAIAHGACTRPPNGVRMQTRQSPISSRNRSTTIVRSEGTAPVASCCSRRNVSRFARGALVEVVLARAAASAPSRRCSADSSREAAPIFWPSSYGRPTPSPFQNGTAPGTPGRRRDEHAVARDLLDPPRRGAEQERLARARLVDHLLVELADAAAAVDEEDAEQAAVGDRAGVRDREPARAVAGADRAAGAVPDDARAQLGELVGRVAAGEHVEHVLELRAREVAERIRARDERVQVVDADLLVGRDRDDLLREHVERVARDRRSPRSRPRASRARRPRTRAGRRGTSGRCGPSRRRRARGPARPMRCRPRATDFGDSTWITRSTAPMSMPSSRLEVATRHGIAPCLQILLDEHALLARERAVVRAAIRDARRPRASSFSRSASRSASRRLLTKTIVERCSSTSRRISG